MNNAVSGDKTITRRRKPRCGAGADLAELRQGIFVRLLKAEKFDTKGPYFTADDLRRRIIPLREEADRLTQLCAARLDIKGTAPRRTPVSTLN